MKSNNENLMKTYNFIYLITMGKSKKIVAILCYFKKKIINNCLQIYTNNNKIIITFIKTSY